MLKPVLDQAEGETSNSCSVLPENIKAHNACSKADAQQAAIGICHIRRACITGTVSRLDLASRVHTQAWGLQGGFAAYNSTVAGFLTVNIE